jgi:hypothetical protein
MTSKDFGEICQNVALRCGMRVVVVAAHCFCQHTTNTFENVDITLCVAASMLR